MKQGAQWAPSGQTCERKVKVLNISIQDVVLSKHVWVVFNITFTQIKGYDCFEIHGVGEEATLCCWAAFSAVKVELDWVAR